jgi:hypothetical protein
MIQHLGFIFISFFLISKPGKQEHLRQNFDKAGYYTVMASGDIGAVDSMLSVLQQGAGRGKEAYEGAMLMKKAGLLRKPKEKLTVFKSGARKLETALVEDSANAEYHFLRLIIQEHAPAAVHYNKDEEKDSQVIYRSFRHLSPVVQKAIMDYSRHSKFLRVKNLNG